MVIIHNRERRYLYVTPEDFEIAKENGIHEKLVKTRVYRDGWEINRAITQKPIKKVFEPWERWKDKAVVGKMTFYSRLYSKGKRGIKWTEEEAALTPKGIYPGGHRNALILTDEQKAIAEKNGISKRIIRYRINKMKMTIDEAVSIPPMDKVQAGKIRAMQRWGKK